MRVRFCGARGSRKCGPPKGFGMTAGRPDRAPMLYHMRKKPLRAGRRGKSGVRFRLILKRLLRVTNSAGHRPSRSARILQGCQRNWSPACGSPVRCRVKQSPAVRLSAASSALRCWRGSPAPSGSARIADAGARWRRRCNDHAAVHWYCRSVRRFPAHHRAFYTAVFREPLATGTVSHAASWLRSGMLGSWAIARVALLCSCNS
jgi:hypothetical protein